MHYYPHHIGDFIKDTAHLDDHQMVTYLRMIWTYYTDEKPITGDIEDIAFAMRSHEKTVRLLLRHFFTETPEGWRHGRCDREIERYHDKSDTNRRAAQRRWENANAMRTQCERIADASENHANERVFDATQEPITNNHIPPTKVGGVGARKKTTARRCPADFTLTDEMREWAVENAPNVDLDVSTGTFMDHEFKQAKTDWKAAWRNWLRRDQAEAEDQARRKPRNVHNLMTFKERDEERARDRYTEITGKVHPDRLPKTNDRVIDITPDETTILEYHNEPADRMG